MELEGPEVGGACGDASKRRSPLREHQRYTWALDPATGTELWYQEFKREGTGIAMLATMRDGASDARLTAGPAHHSSSEGGGGGDGGGD